MSTEARSPRISVVGGSKAPDRVLDIARETGRRIAMRDAVLVCGGMGGVMRAACRGAKEENGTTIGIVPTRNPSDANEFVDVPIVTGMGDARNVSVVLSGQGVIAIDGKFGTLSEIALALNASRPLAAIDAPAVASYSDLQNVKRARDPRTAVEWTFQYISS